MRHKRATCPKSQCHLAADFQGWSVEFILPVSSKGSVRASCSAALRKVWSHICSQQLWFMTDKGKEGERQLQLSCQAFIILYAYPELNIFYFISAEFWHCSKCQKAVLKVSKAGLDCYFSESCKSEILKSVGKVGPCIHSNMSNKSCTLIGW